MIKPLLYLASGSKDRQRALRAIGIDFKRIDHAFDETSVEHKGNLSDVLLTIARGKMQHAIIPAGVEGEHCFVLTADTMGQDSEGVIHGKPRNKQEAIEQIKSLRGNGRCGTAFCLEKREFRNGKWYVLQTVEECVIAEYRFNIPDHWIERYLQAVPEYLSISGSITIDGYGAQFLQSIAGSYSTIEGLPLYELRNALEKIGFYKE